MELIYLHYHAAGKPSRYILLLSLGQRNGKYSGIATDVISDGDRTKIVQQADRLSGLSLERKIEWLRTHCPVAFKAGFREIHIQNCTILSNHPLGRI